MKKLLILAALLASTVSAQASNCSQNIQTYSSAVKMINMSANAIVAEGRNTNVNVYIMKAHAENIERQANIGMVALENVERIPGKCDTSDKDMSEAKALMNKHLESARKF